MHKPMMYQPLTETEAHGYIASDGHVYRGEPVVAIYGVIGTGRNVFLRGTPDEVRSIANAMLRDADRAVRMAREECDRQRVIMASQARGA